MSQEEIVQEEVIPEEIPLTEHFSYAKITWKIENISIVLCPLSQSVTSEEFQITGREDTLWQLKLGTVHELNYAGLCLRMLGPDEKFFSPQRREPGLSVNCYANILDSNGEQPLKAERQFLFSFRDCIEIETFDLSDIVRNLAHTGPDNLIIRCFILIDHGERVDVPAEVPCGLTELSRTLSKIVEDPLFPDIQIKVNDKAFYLHKVMLSNLRSMDPFRDPVHNHVRLLNHCEYSVATIFNYAYSGNINHVISAPRIRVADDIDRFGLEELFGAYPKEIIPLCSTVEVREFTCTWKIEDHELGENSLNGPEINALEANTRWKICMYPKGKINGNVQEKKYVFLEATLLESTKNATDINIEFCSLNENEIVYSRRDHRRMKVGDKLEVPFFLRGGSLMKKCLIDSKLSLRITLWISKEETATRMDPVFGPHPFVWTNAQTMNFFARKMRNILASEENWDLALSSANVLYNVHKFVLASRSTYCKNRMTNSHQQTIVVPDFRPHFMRVFLENLYTALYSDMEFNANCHLFEFGFFFEVNHLKERCSHEVDFFNLLRVFQYAVQNNLHKLRQFAFQHIVNCGQDITTHPEWTDFFNTKTNLAYTIISYWRN